MKVKIKYTNINTIKRLQNKVYNSRTHYLLKKESNN